MNCRTFDKKLYDYLDGTLETREKAEFDLHRSGCARCVARMETESQMAEVVRTSVEDACKGLELDLSAGARSIRSALRDRSRSWRFPAWRIVGATAALLIVVLLLPAIARRLMPESSRLLPPEQNVAENHDSWTQEIHVTYENGLQAETTLISHDSSGESIIEIQVCYFP